VKSKLLPLLLMAGFLENLALAQSNLGLRAMLLRSEGRSTSASPAVELHTAEQRSVPPTQLFVCDSGYTQRLCAEHMAVLRRALSRYPEAQLENWTWILVRSQDWKAILTARGLDPDSPAFSYPSKRQTFIEEALVSLSAVRGRELLMKWNLQRSALLDYAIRHELGHTLCKITDERKADRVARHFANRKKDLVPKGMTETTSLEPTPSAPSCRYL
jgi:hypothetical protein